MAAGFLPGFTMDSQINAAARALAAGNPLAALDGVALRDDPPALALRGIAMAQLGELSRARELLKAAAKAFGTDEPLARARCVTAQEEISLAMRELGGSDEALKEAIARLERHDDRVNALHARVLVVRRMLLSGRCDEAEREVAMLQLSGAPVMHVAIVKLIAGDLAMRRIDPKAAAKALDDAHRAATMAGIPALVREVEGARQRLGEPAARLCEGGRVDPVDLFAVAELTGSSAMIVDGCRYRVIAGSENRDLTRRPVLFALLRALALAWPEDVAREDLARDVFDASPTNTAWRGRLRVEVGRLRQELAGLSDLVATERGFLLEPAEAKRVVVLAPPVDGDNAAVLALLSDGAPWSTSALALALGVSQRTAQRALASLAEEGRVSSMGRGRALRWLAPPESGYTMALLLPGITG